MGRTIRYTATGLEWEADEKLVRGLLAEYELEDNVGVETAGMKEDGGFRSESKMTASEAARFRKGAAILNYLSQDRPDISYSSKELCREFAVPTVTSFKKLKRLARYLSGMPRIVYNFEWQPMPKSP